MTFDINRYVEKENKKSFIRFFTLQFLKIKRKFRKKQAIKKWGIKNGFRRLILVIISIISLCVFCLYITNGFIFDTSKLVNSTIIKSEQSLKELPILDFAASYLDKKDKNGFTYNSFNKENNSIDWNKYWSTSDIICKSYQQTCKFEGYEPILINNKSFKLNILDNRFKDDNTAVLIMPTRIKYFSWQLFDFIKIIFFSIVVYLLYLLVEFILCWVFAGFNINFSNLKFPKIELNKNFTTILIVTILAGTYIYVEHSKIAYQEKLRQEKISEENFQKKQLEGCLSDAYDNYISNWNKACHQRKLKDDCSLPAYNADTIEKWRSDAKNECMEKYKNKGFN